MLKQMDLRKFKHNYSITVRNYEIDWQGIVHNGNYLLYFESARVDYFKHVGMEIDQRTINGKTKIVVVRNELDYSYPVTFGDTVTIHTRITEIGNSSIRCEAVMILAGSMIMVSSNVCILVWTDPAANKSIIVPEYFRKRVHKYENGDAVIASPTAEK
jgi:acyl-CoA thioester hydrolase